MLLLPVQTAFWGIFDPLVWQKSDSFIWKVYVVSALLYSEEVL